MNIREEVLWVEKYRPKKIGDTILPDNLKTIFQKFVEDKSVPNLLLTGTAGIGKTTVARAMLEEIDADYLIINGSLEGRNIDTLRTTIKDFASTVSMAGGRKYVILDEADYLNSNSTQPALRNFMEEYSKNCGFILTCNFAAKIIDPLQSRCAVVHFKINKTDKAKIATQFFKRAVGILETENVPYEKAVVGELITKHFPDWRRVLNELQTYSKVGKIDAGIFSNQLDNSFSDLIGFLKEKNFTKVRTWIGENGDIEPSDFFRKFYDEAYNVVNKSDIPQLVIYLSDYQFKSAFVADQEINMAAFLTQCMVDIGFQ